MSGRVVAVCIAASKGVPKDDVGAGLLVPGIGIEGDAHAGFAHRQVSLLNMEDLREMQAKLPELRPGSFAENLTVEGFDLGLLQIGHRLRVGEALLEVTQIGKECHTRCAIYHTTGDCIMPRKGVFCRVLKGGVVRRGDKIALEVPEVTSGA
jgi:MOSC domain-containing protein YiiM